MSSVNEKLELRKKGMSYSEIARELGISRQAVYESIAKYEEPHYRYMSEKKCIYPNIRDWMNERRIGVTKMCEMLGYEVHTNTVNRIKDVLSGRNNARKEFIDRVLNATGMTYEIAFAEAVKHEE